MSESENVKSGNDYLLKDLEGLKVRCKNNVSNRPLYMSTVDKLKQEILRKKWKFNFENIIVGKTGLILNGQHTLIALVLACQEWEKYPGKWIEWQSEPTIDKSIGFGVDETDETVNTMDTCKPRTLADVLYRSQYFRDVSASDRKAVARICSYAINTIWERTGASQAFAPYQTHQESMQFLELHPKIVTAVQHIHIEDGDNNISRYLSPGYAAGMMYLMAASKSEPKKYISDPSEKSLDLSNWDKAEEFFVLLSAGAEEFAPIQLALRKMLEDDGGSRRERLALIAKAWSQWAVKYKLTSLKLRYREEEGVKILAEDPSVGGIDLISHSPEDL